MSIGFSVDYSAHITYGYVCSTQQTPREKIREALGALGWPLTQGAISTILAVVVLADVPAYMIVTFFKVLDCFLYKIFTHIFRRPFSWQSHWALCMDSFSCPSHWCCLYAADAT
jgi:hypothetical protein